MPEAASTTSSSKKRVASNSDDDAPPSHRSKRNRLGADNDAYQPSDDDDQQATQKPVKPPFNLLPTSPEHISPSRQLFVFGNGDCGQFGLGTKVTGDIPRPQLHKWFQDESTKGTLGGEGS